MGNKLTREQEIALTRELGELRSRFSLTDESEENRKRGERIREICKELGLNSKPRKNRTPCIYRPR